jgi:hypothetical protein
MVALKLTRLMPLSLVLLQDLDGRVEERTDVAGVPVADQQLLMDFVSVLVVDLE